MIRALLVLLLLVPQEEKLPRFREQGIDDRLAEPWDMAIADVNADGRPDVLALSWNPPVVFWYENPAWKKRVLIEKEPRELVVIEPVDADGDGKTEFVLGAGYHEPPDPKKGGGEIYLLTRPDDLEKPWTPVKLGEIPTLHRIHLLDGKDLVCSALHGPTVVLRRPARPFSDPWISETIAETLRACHNTLSIDWDGDGKQEVLTASREGLQLWTRREKWAPTLLARGSGGVSEIAVGRLPGGKRYLATIEPHHGHEFCVYTEEGGAPSGWKRQVLLVNKGGHTLWPADLTKTGVDSLLVGFVGAYSKHPGGPCWYLFHPLDDRGERWEKRLLDEKNTTGEDGECADLNGDGRIDAVSAGGRAVKVYWNEGP